MYICRYFAIHELIPPKVFKARADKAWELLDPDLLRALDALRSRYGPMTINNYYWSGEREWSGLRTPDGPYYSPYSQHTFGRAADCLFKEVSVEQVRTDILSFPNDTTFELINAVELDVSWLHIDVRNCSRVKVFEPR